MVSAISEGIVPRSGCLPTRSKCFQLEFRYSDLTAGLPVTLAGTGGPPGKVFGLESFGYSAPYKVLDEKLGFTGENVFTTGMRHAGSIA